MNREKISVKLRSMRGKRTLQAVSDEIGVTPSALSQYENGARVPRDEVKCKLAEYYGVTVQELFYDD